MTGLVGVGQRPPLGPFDRDHAGYAGQFIWTGTDYIGEPTPWHNQNDTPVKSSYFGIVDTAGLPKNDFYLYQSQWVRRETSNWSIFVTIE